jgi:Acyl-CoA reductase (LuxC)
VNVTLLVPDSGPIAIDDLCARLRAPEARLEPFSPPTLAFCDSFSRALFRDSAARRFPELQALAFWLRKSELQRMKEQFEALCGDRTVMVPRGLVFHIPPSNVDTIFIYSWITSALAGNANIIRFSERGGEAALTICRILGELPRTAHFTLERGTAIVRYGRESEITAAISAACDVRVIWGGDATVHSIRAIPLSPHATELVFPDRKSLAVFHAGVYSQLEEKGRNDLAVQFYNDTFWFDQMACASPRLMVWIGSKQTCETASRNFLESLEREVRLRGYQLATGAKLNKLTFAYRAILDQPAVEQQRLYGSEITVLQLSSLTSSSREHCGGGLLFQAWTPALDDLAAIVERRDQTLTQFGFPHADLLALVHTLNGRGVDRIVPAGQALTFNRYWDGYDLLREFTRTVYLDA